VRPPRRLPSTARRSKKAVHSRHISSAAAITASSCSALKSASRAWLASSTWSGSCSTWIETHWLSVTPVVRSIALPMLETISRSVVSVAKMNPRALSRSSDAFR
jgi:hypothetical protein